MTDTNKFNKNEIDMVIYHSPCADGFGAAYAVWKYYRETNNQREVEYVGAGFGTKVPNVTGKNVLICDFSYPLHIIKKIREEAKTLLIIDHHITAQKELQDLDGECKIFDMNHSGAVLTWKYFYPDREVPLMIRYIEDRDIWKKQMENNGEFIAWFHKQEMKFEIYDEICENRNNEIQKGIEKGRYFLELEKYNTKQISQYASPKFIKLSNREKEEFQIVAHINSNVLKSDIGNEIFNQMPFIDASVVYTIGDGTNSTIFSLRSTNFHADVSAIAKNYLGGGGHRNASGAGTLGLVNCISSKVYDDVSYYLIKEGIYYDTTGDIKIVYLNSAHHKYPLGKYLLQTKFVIDNSNHREICNVTNIKALKETMAQCENVDWEDSSEFVKVFKENLEKTENFGMAAIWHYLSDDSTAFTIVFSEKMDKSRMKKICQEYLCLSDSEIGEDELCYKIRFKGFHNYLNGSKEFVKILD